MLAAITLLAAVLRIYALDFQSLWLNELDSWWMSRQDSVRLIVERGIIPDPHPPGYQLLLYLVIHAFGDSEAVLRTPSVVAGILSIPFVALLGRRLFDPVTGLLGAALFAVLWAPVYYSQEGRTYALLMLLCIAAMYFLLRICQETAAGRDAGWPSRVAFVLCAVGSCYLHYFGLLMIGVHGLVLLMWLGLTRQTVGLLAAVGLLYLPWLPSLWQDLQIAEHTIPPMRLRSVARYYVFAFNQSLVLAFAVALPLQIAACRQAYRLHVLDARGGTAWRRDPILLLLIWILVPTGATFVKSIVSLSVWTDRNLLICVAPMYLLVARGIVLLPLARMARTIVGVGVVLAMLAHLTLIRSYYTTPTKEDYRGAVEQVLTRDPAGETPVVGARYAYYYDYYFERLGGAPRVALTALTGADVARLAELAARAPEGRFWLLQGSLFPPEPVLQRYLDKHFDVLEQTSLTRSRVTLYQHRAGGAEAGPGRQ